MGLRSAAIGGLVALAALLMGLLLLIIALAGVVLKVGLLIICILAVWFVLSLLGMLPPPPLETAEATTVAVA